MKRIAIATFLVGAAAVLGLGAGGQLTGGGGLTKVIHDASLTGSGTTATPLGLPTSGVSAGTFAPASVTVNAQGIVTAASTTTIAGKYLATQLLTASSGTYTPTSGTTRAHVRMIGGGGGGGGATSSTGDAAGGGGTTGVLLEFTTGTAGVTLTGGSFATGAGGAAGSSAGGQGGTGGDTTITIGGTLFTAKGGGGGFGSGNVLTVSVTNAASVPPAGTSAVGVSSWWSGGYGFALTTGGAWQSGFGGSSPLGPGGTGAGGTNNGVTGTAGGGGGGGATGGVGSSTGGTGGRGVILIDEFSALWRRRPVNDIELPREAMAA